jgi:hypothetical protein
MKVTIKASMRRLKKLKLIRESSDRGVSKKEINSRNASVGP